MFEELEGHEFEWFAIDKAGQIAIFATGGWGAIPELISPGFINHKFISKELELPHWDSMAFWTDFARYGLYVYDWQPYEGPYHREAAPLVAIDESLKQRILSLENLPKFDLNFESAQAIRF